MAVPTCFNRTKKYLLTALLPFLALCVTLTAVPVRAESVIATIGVGDGPRAVAVNPVTNKIYVANAHTGNVTVIDGVSNSTVSVTVGSAPGGVAVNPVTNKIYVANPDSNNVTVIDGVTNTTSTIAVGVWPIAIAVNSVTNNIYVTNFNSNSITVINGVTNVTTTITTVARPWALAINPVTNRIYVANPISNNVTVIDGATNVTSTVTVGSEPTAIAVNPVTNKVYVANRASNNVTVIDGTTTTTVAVAVVNTVAGFGPDGIAVNPVTNQIYVVNGFDTVTVIDGASNATTTVAVGDRAYSLAVNSATNKIYVVNANSNTVTVIDGATNTTTTVAVGSFPVTLALNPVTNRIYVVNVFSDNISVIGDLNTDTTPPTLTMPSLVDSYTVGSAVVFTFSATDTQSQIASIAATLNGNPVSSGGMVILSQLGLNTFTLTATDTAGNTATQTREFVVSYGFGGFLSPLTDDDDDSRATFHLGRVIPVKFGLYDANGAPISTAVAHLSLQKFSGNNPVGDPIDATSPGGANAGTLFRYSHGRYIYNLSTKALTAGTWSLQVMLDDGTVQTIMIRLTSRRHHD